LRYQSLPAIYAPGNQLPGVFPEIEDKMGRLLLIAGIILLVLWLLGLITSVTFGGGIHVVLVIAIILIVIWLVAGRRR
jgi:hypothetical protein